MPWGQPREKHGQECRSRRYLEAYLWNERQVKKGHEGPDLTIHLQNIGPVAHQPADFDGFFNARRVQFATLATRYGIP